MRGWMDDSIHSIVPSSVVARWREEPIACGYGGKEMKWWPLCRLWSDSIVVAATAVAMATIRMAMSCPTLSSSSSAFQVLTSHPALQFPSSLAILDFLSIFLVSLTMTVAIRLIDVSIQVDYEGFVSFSKYEEKTFLKMFLTCFWGNSVGRSMQIVWIRIRPNLCRRCPQVECIWYISTDSWVEVSWTSISNSNKFFSLVIVHATLKFSKYEEENVCQNVSHVFLRPIR